MAKKTTETKTTAPPKKTAGKQKKETTEKKTKRPPSAYLLFVKATRANVKEQNPELGFGDLTKMVAEAWKSLSEEDKKPYIEQAKEAKEALTA